LIFPRGDEVPRPAKTAAVEEITGRFNESNAALLTEYRGLTVGEIQELRRALRAADTDYKVLKNTLTRIAVKEAGLDELTAHLVGPTAIAFVKGDAVAAAKALDDAAKKYPVLVIKGGVIDGKFIDADQTKALARLEPREVQLAKIAMLMNTPLQQTVNVFAALLRDLGSMLAQVIAKKESGELPGGSGEAPVAEAAPAEAPAEPEPAAEAEAPAEAAAEEAVVEEPAAEAPAPEVEAAEAVAETETTTAEAAEESVEAASDTEEETAEGGQDKEE
jgi:large subunit ribosomal protein L10